MPDTKKTIEELANQGRLLLENISPETEYVLDEKEEPHGVKPEDTLQMLIYIFEHAIKYRGNAQDYENLATAKVELMEHAINPGDLCTDIIEDLSKSIIREPNPQRYFMLGQAYVNMRDYCEGDPYSETSLLRKAMFAFRKSMEGKDSFDVRQELADALIDYSVALDCKNENDDESKSLEKLEKNEKSATSKNEEKTKSLEEAIALLKGGIEKFKEERDETYYSLGTALCGLASTEKHEDDTYTLFKEAVKMFEKSIRLNQAKPEGEREKSNSSEAEAGIIYYKISNLTGDPEMKRQYLQRSITYLSKTAENDCLGEDRRTLARAQVSLSKEIPDANEKEKLRKNAIYQLRRAHQSTKDPEILQEIEDIKTGRL